MRPRIARALALAALLSALGAAPAAAHQGDPRFRSVAHGIVPPAPGIAVEVLGYDDQLQLTNRSGRTVVIDGYRHEPYVRMLPDGTVQENRRSPAVYLNEDRYGDVPVPRSADPRARPRWRLLDRTGRFVWHDHRMHWMTRTLPPQVKDESRRTKVFDYSIPLRIGDRPARISGTLWWVGSPGGFPLAAIVSLVAVAALALAGVTLLRRRRRRADGGGGGGGRGVDGREPREAW